MDFLNSHASITIIWTGLQTTAPIDSFCMHTHLTTTGRYIHHAVKDRRTQSARLMSSIRTTFQLTSVPWT